MKSLIYLSVFVVLIFTLSSLSIQDAHATSMTFAVNTTITADSTIYSGETWTVNDGITLTINPGVNVFVLSGGRITNDGTIINKGHIGIDGDIDSRNFLFNEGTIDNAGTITNKLGGNFYNIKTILNSDTINNSGGTITNNGTITDNGGGTINNNSVDSIITNNSGGDINNLSGGYIRINVGIFHNYGTVDNFGSIIGIGGTMYNYSGGVFGNSGILSIDFSIRNSGTIYLNSDGITSNAGLIENDSGGTINNNGPLTNTNVIRNYGTINNYSTIDNKIGISNNLRGIYNYAGGIFGNSGTIKNSHIIFNSGTFYNNSDGTITNNINSLINNDDGEIYNDGPITSFGIILRSYDSTFTNSSIIQQCGLYSGFAPTGNPLTFFPCTPPDTTDPITTATPPGGTYGSPQSVILSSNEPATIYYTTNNSPPTTSSTVYSLPIPISANTNLKFFAKDTAGNEETVKTEVYTIISFVPVTHMSDTTASSGDKLHSGRPIHAEYVTPTSQLVGDKIDSITLKLKRTGTLTGLAQIGVFNTDLSVKKLFGTVDSATMSVDYADLVFSLPIGQTYQIQSGDRIGIKFTGGDSTNRISVMRDLDAADPFDGVKSYHTYYTTVWSPSTTNDLYMILKQSSP